MTVTSQPVAAPSSVELEVQRIRGLVQEHRFGEAVTAAAALRTLYPENRDVLYLLALAQRHGGQIADALDTLADMERHHPAGEPSLPGARPLLTSHSRMRRARSRRTSTRFRSIPLCRPPGACSRVSTRWSATMHSDSVAAAHVQKLKSVPPDVITATGLFCEGELAAAEKLIRAFLLRHGDHVEAMRLLARIGVAREVLDDAEVLLAAALKMAPDYIELRRDYACVLLDRHKHAEAIAQLDDLLKLDPKNIDYRTLRATATVGLGDHEGGLRRFVERARGH